MNTNAVELVELIGLRERIEKRLVGVLPIRHRVNAVMTIGAEFNQLLLTTHRVTEMVRSTQNGNGAAARDGGASPSTPASPVAAGAAPLPCIPRPFKLVRLVDHSGVSGTGDVVEGVQFTDGSVAVRWHGDHPSTAVWPSIADVLVVHGHGGDTVLRWLDEAVSS
jgi:hypothetical protein